MAIDRIAVVLGLFFILYFSWGFWGKHYIKNIPEIKLEKSNIYMYKKHPNSKERGMK